MALKPQAVADAIERIVPKELHERLGVHNWQWTKQLLEGGLANARSEVIADAELFTERIQLAIQDSDYRSADRFKRIRATVFDRDLLSYFASKNVLPKYGFPVDVVDLQTKYVPSSEGQRLDLSRDLRIALTEYAPGSELVAGGRIWVGGGLNTRPLRQGSGGAAKAWDQWGYAVCPNCLRFNQLHLSEEPPSTCQQCHGPLDSGFQNLRGVYVKPEFGFVASPEEPKKSGEGRPKRLYSSRIFFADYNQDPTVAERVELIPSQGGSYTATFARGGQLAVVNAGLGGAGFRLCETCGFGEPAPKYGRKVRTAKKAKHKDPRSGRVCGGTLRSLHLGHTFETDVLSIGIRNEAAVGQEARRSLLYALLEGASGALGISRGDLDGVVFGLSPLPEVLIYDNVPGGAGHSKRIGEHFTAVLQAAFERISACECGPETSCYECLRNYSNQPYHATLARRPVLDLLNTLLNVSA